MPTYQIELSGAAVLR